MAREASVTARIGLRIDRLSSKAISPATTTEMARDAAIQRTDAAAAARAFRSMSCMLPWLRRRISSARSLMRLNVGRMSAK